ncbi:hepatitis A virus cellular receptor 1 homolog isoform X2 [Gouania willdenowi]|uniref:hepatitis A virus cellular receptor 1 homolog isoform X2 n=1 Tax=Gouania willdenowi TaxID=441366 RepID=UPI0010568573|nr:hepatitis A virus cellular receptor 1 homolog isoform X2 [Gouania willdenowi]
MKLLQMLLLSVLERSSSSISVVVGHSVTFSCVYDIKHYGPLPVCWGRGQIPIRGCDQRLLSTDAHQVIEDTRASSRYQLLGELDRGDVSLTILNISEADAETYGCRVEIPGWFNDHKHHFELRVAPEPSFSFSSSPTPLQLNSSTTASRTAGHMTSNDTHLTLTPETVNRREGGEWLTVILISVISVLTAVGIVIMVRRWRHKKLPQQNNASSTRFSLSLSSQQLRGSAVDNIYQMECDEFDLYCPYDQAH